MQILQFSSFFTENKRGIWRTFLPPSLRPLLSFFKLCSARPAYFWISCHLLHRFLWIARIKNNNVWLGRTETLAFHSSRGTVYLHVAHHSTWITLSNLGFRVDSWSAQWLLALCSPGSSSFVMEMKLGPSLGSKGENRQQQIEPDPWPSSKASSGDVIRGEKTPRDWKRG